MKLEEAKNNNWGAEHGCAFCGEQFSDDSDIVRDRSLSHMLVHRECSSGDTDD